jgi:hypothetical protein
MKTENKADYSTRDAILKLLSDAELAKVCTAETAADLPAGEEYLDLEDLESGLRKAPVVPGEMGRVLSRTAVLQETWGKILRQLSKLPPTVQPG